MIILKSESDIAQIKKSCVVVARVLRLLNESIVPGKTTTKDLDTLAFRLIAEAGGRPSFLNYRNYPGSICASVNNVVIHGIPNDKPLQNGDIIDIDVGVFLNGWHGDSAWTYAVGTIADNAQRLLNVTRESLYQGIAQAKVGNKVGDISATVQKYCESHGYGVVRELVGHGIGRNLHEEPSVANFGKAGKGPVLKAGMTMCIEPMVNEGTAHIHTLADNWTMLTNDGKLSAHFEHTIAITKSGPVILTTEED